MHQNRIVYDPTAWAHRRHRERWLFSAWRALCMLLNHGWPTTRWAEGQSRQRKRAYILKEDFQNTTGLFVNQTRDTLHTTTTSETTNSRFGDTCTSPVRQQGQIHWCDSPWMLSRRILRWRLAPPFPSPCKRSVRCYCRCHIIKGSCSPFRLCRVQTFEMKIWGGWVCWSDVGAKWIIRHATFPFYIRVGWWLCIFSFVDWRTRSGHVGKPDRVCINERQQPFSHLLTLPHHRLSTQH